MNLTPAPGCTGNWPHDGHEARDCFDLLVAGQITPAGLCGSCALRFMTAIEWVSGREFDWPKTFTRHMGWPADTEGGEPA